MIDDRIIDDLIVVFVLPSLVVAIPAIPFAIASAWDWAVVGHRRAPLRLWHVAIAVGAVGLMMGATRPGGRAWFVVASLILLAAFAHAWRREVAYLMGLPDENLPALSARVLWLILLVGLAPVGLWFFRYHRSIRRPETIDRDEVAATRDRPEISPA